MAEPGRTLLWCAQRGRTLVGASSAFLPVAGKARGCGRRAKREEVFEAMSIPKALRQKPARAVREGVAEAGPACDEAGGPRQGPEDTGSALLAAALTRKNMKQAFRRLNV